MKSDLNQADLKPNPAQDLKLFSEVEEPPLISPRFWTNLLHYRPLLVLGGLWFVLICMAAVAYSRLMFTGTPKSSQTATANAIHSTRSAPLLQSDQNAESADQSSGASPSAPMTAKVGLEEGSKSSAQPSDTVPFESNFPGWPVVATVGLCAAGSLVLSRRISAPPKASKRKLGKAKAAKPISRTRLKSPPPPSGPKRLEPFRTEEDNWVVPQAARSQAVTPEGSLHPSKAETGTTAETAAATDSSHLPVATPEAGKETANGRALPSIRSQGEMQATRSSVSSMPVSTSKSLTFEIARPSSSSKRSTTSTAEEAESTEVTLVAEDEYHPLDWPEGSLANALDLRNRRSLSSFL